MGPHRLPNRDLQAQRRRAIRLSQGNPRSHRRGPPRRPNR